MSVCLSWALNTVEAVDRPLFHMILAQPHFSPGQKKRTELSNYTT